MKAVIARADAESYASWFRALADPTRIQVLNLIASGGGEMTVGEIADALPVAQSTVSHHLRILVEVRFLLVRAEGTANNYRINDRCIQEFPSAADIIIGRPSSANTERVESAEGRLR